MQYKIIDKIGRWARRSPAGFLFHAALLLILAGAFITYFCASHGEVGLSHDKAAERFVNDSGEIIRFPFILKLRGTDVEYHEGSTAPKDFRVNVEVMTDSGDAKYKTLSMNKVLVIGGYRFCLKKFDGEDVVLSVNRDPWGIGVTYAGYFLLFACSMWILLSKTVKVFLCRKTAVAAMIMLCALQVHAGVAGDAFGSIRVYWGERPAAMETMCNDILARVHGKPSYNGMKATDVMLGWLFEYDNWMREPIVKVKGESVKKAIGIDDGYASYNDFFGPDGYKLQPLLGNLEDTDVRQADERIKLMSAWCAGSLMKIYPYHTANGHWEWLTPVDAKPSMMPLEQWTFVSTSFNDVARCLSLGNREGAAREFGRIAEYQIKQLPVLSQRKLHTEIFYGRYGDTLVAALIAIAAGLCGMYDGGARKFRRVMLVFVSSLLWVWLTAMVGIRWYLTGHFPLVNGFETMQALAWLSVSGAWIISVRGYSGLRFAAICILVSGMALMVCRMGGGNSISPLMPVLASPLLSVHVLIIMGAYLLAALMFVNSVYGLVVRGSTGAKCCAESLRLLEPTVILLACGIFVGAIWANMSWGRYWGWDPKETWALVTMIVYSVPLHRRWIRPLRSPVSMNLFLAAAFFCVLMTYFGVNFFLGGMHSYA